VVRIDLRLHLHLHHRLELRRLIDDLCTYLDTSGAQRTSRLPEWEDFQELAEEYEVTP
jgi:hypothetical protein